MSPVRFGVDVSTAATPGSDPVADARRAERLGFDFVSASDHPGGASPSYETWTMLSWVAAATSRIHIATRVLGVPYRSPALLAKMAASFDRLSGGRLILGLGGGASDDEFRAYGLDVRTPREKVDALAEAIRVIRALWTRPRASFEGRHYRIEDAPLEPKPLRPIPIWLGTFGDRALGVTGELADGWIPTLGYAPGDRLAGMRQRVLGAAQRAGRDPEALACALNLAVHVGTGDEVDDPDVVTGTAATVADRLAGFVRQGFTTVNLQPVGSDVDDQVERLATDVLPQVRSLVAS
jgi:probable F420-dependent oxidoreductase